MRYNQRSDEVKGFLMRSLPVARWVASLLFLTAVANANAGIYTAAEPTPFRMEAERGVELPYVPQFKSFLDDRLNAVNPALPDTLDGKATFRGAAKLRIEHRGKNPNQVALAVDYIRIGKAADAVNLLEARTRDRVPDYVALVTLAHAHAARGEWSDAIRVHGLATFDAEPPALLPGANADQTRWLVKLERDYYARWLRLRQQETLLREPPEVQNVYTLFPAKSDAPSLKFVNEAGQYDPGQLAAAEKTKLPPDALAVVQQLLLWSPDDTRMLWLLAEVYAANGQLREADQIFDQCTWGRGYTNRKILMAHRTATREAVAKLPPEAGDVALPSDAVPAEADAVVEQRKWDEIRDKVVLLVALFGTLAVVLITLQIRTLLRRRAARYR